MDPTCVFIHSSAHSGSTWIGYVLGSTTNSVFVGELHRAWDAAIRVPCTVCAAKGLDECAVLSGIEHQPPEDAFATLSARTGRRAIVDNSKVIAWTQKFMASGQQDLRLVHVLKDPRGWYASVRRRNPSDIDWSLEQWCEENSRISDFIRSSGQPHRVVMYDIVARNPLDEFRSLFEFCGIPFRASAIEYWNTEHHGFAANGASAAIIRHANFTSPPSHFSTADDRFYNEVWSKSFVDERWKIELSDAESGRIASNQRVRRILLDFGYELTRSGVERARKRGLKAALATIPPRLRAIGRSIRS